MRKHARYPADPVLALAEFIERKAPSSQSEEVKAERLVAFLQKQFDFSASYARNVISRAKAEGSVYSSRQGYYTTPPGLPAPSYPVMSADDERFYTQLARDEHDPAAGTLQVGYIVEVFTPSRPDNGEQGWVGIIEAVDERGIRITLIDWIVGRFCNWDRYFPWRRIDEVRVATHHHYIIEFLKDIRRRTQPSAPSEAPEATSSKGDPLDEKMGALFHGLGNGKPEDD